MARQYVHQLRDNEKVEEIYRLSDKQVRSNKNGNLYLQFHLSDRTGVIGCRLWNVDATFAEQFDNGDYVLVEGTTQRFQKALQMIVKKMTKIDPDRIGDPTEFERSDNIDVEARMSCLRELLQTLTDPNLRNLADCFLLDETFWDRFRRAPAGVKLHHACPGGLLEHTTRMMEHARKVAELYPILNRDLLLFGAFLHDIGKTAELSYDGEMFYTDAGQMLGHSLLGIEILNEKIAEAEKLLGEPFHAETAMLLKHLLISHHGTYENQSTKLPMTLEAVALHLIDTMDSKLAEFRKYMLEDPNIGGVWTNYIPGIDRKLYKGKVELEDTEPAEPAV